MSGSKIKRVSCISILFAGLSLGLNASPSKNPEFEAAGSSSSRSFSSSSSRSRLREIQNELRAKQLARAQNALKSASQTSEVEKSSLRSQVPIELKTMPQSFFSAFSDPRFQSFAGPFSSDSNLDQSGLVEEYPLVMDWVLKNAGAFAWVKKNPKVADLAFRSPQNFNFIAGHPEVVAWSLTHPVEALHSEQYAKMPQNDTQLSFGSQKSLRFEQAEAEKANVIQEPELQAEAQGYPKEFLPREIPFKKEPSVIAKSEENKIELKPSQRFSVFEKKPRGNVRQPEVKVVSAKRTFGIMLPRRRLRLPGFYR